MSIDTIKMITDGGGIGVALFSIVVLYRIVTNHEKHFLDAIQKNSDALITNSKAFQKLCDVIESLKHE